MIQKNGATLMRDPKTIQLMACIYSVRDKPFFDIRTSIEIIGTG